jgi:16S rRNA (guanine966-N2)-methyltransferase
VTRIIAGSAGGRRVAVSAGQGTRPTSDRVREALFAALQARGLLAGARVLDLYAGSGALGLEAASRGADSVVLVESGPQAVAAIRRNITSLALPGVRVVPSAVERFLKAGARDLVDLVLIDPPYALTQDELGDVLAALVTGAWLAQDAVVLVERSRRSGEPAWPTALARQDERRYGETTVWWAQHC